MVSLSLNPSSVKLTALMIATTTTQLPICANYAILPVDPVLLETRRFVSVAMLDTISQELLVEHLMGLVYPRQTQMETLVSSTYRIVIQSQRMGD